MSEQWPEPGEIIEFKTPEDAKKIEKLLNGIYWQLEALWVHINKLEGKEVNKWSRKENHGDYLIY